MSAPAWRRSYEGLGATVDWYRHNADWVARVKSGEYQKFYEQNYAGRSA